MKHSSSSSWRFLLCACLVVVGAATCWANGTATKPTPAATPKPHSHAGVGLFGQELPCAANQYDQVDKGTNNQSITIYVKPNPAKEPKYAVDIEPRCAGLSHYGNLKFTIDWTPVKDDWDPKNTVDVEFRVPGPDDHNLGPLVKGPYELDPLKQTKRGVYVDVEKNPEIPYKDMSSKVKKDWTDRYTVSVWSPTGQFLGEYDPGVIVVDDPGGMHKK